MTSTIINPDGLHDPAGFGYGHVVTVPSGSDLILVAGQYDSDDQGRTTSADFAAQVDRAFTNLGVALRAVSLDYSDVVNIRTYIVGHDDRKLDALLAALRRIWGDRPPTQTLLGVAALALPDMQFDMPSASWGGPSTPRSPPSRRAGLNGSALREWRSCDGCSPTSPSRQSQMQRCVASLQSLGRRYAWCPRDTVRKRAWSWPACQRTVGW